MKHSLPLLFSHLEEIHCVTDSRTQFRVRSVISFVDWWLGSRHYKTPSGPRNIMKPTWYVLSMFFDLVFLQELTEQYRIAWIEYIIIFENAFGIEFLWIWFFAKLAKRGQLQIIPQKFSSPVRKFELNQLWRKVPTIFNYKKIHVWSKTNLIHLLTGFKKF